MEKLHRTVTLLSSQAYKRLGFVASHRHRDCSASPMWPPGHGGGEDLGSRRWEGYVFAVSRVCVWWDDVYSNKVSPVQPHLNGDVKKLVRVVWSSRASSGYKDLRIIKELYRQFILLLRF
jgi:hypothetical protein